MGYIQITPASLGHMVKFGDKIGLLMTMTDKRAKVVILEEDGKFDEQNINCSDLVECPEEEIPQNLRNYRRFLGPRPENLKN